MATLSPRYVTRHPDTLQISMPVGGLGAGCVCLHGSGGLQDFSIRNRPATTALPDNHDSEHAAFALLRIGGTKPVTRLVEGPLSPEKVYDQSVQAQGYRKGGHEGLPRFRKSSFQGGYPFGRVDLSDPLVPLRVSVTAWNPFVPRDDVASGIPCAIVEYELHNPTRRAAEYEFSYHLSHLVSSGWPSMEKTRNSIIPGRGIFFSSTEPEDSMSFGSASLTVLGHRPRIKGTWVRGGWFDALSAVWREVESGQFKTNDGTLDQGRGGRAGGSILIRGELAAGQRTTIPIVIAWHFPNIDLLAGPTYIHGSPPAARHQEDAAKNSVWHPFYTTQWPSAREVAAYVEKNYASLRARTVAFQNALLNSTVPVETLDAVSANLAILKSPTVLRQSNGHVWGWEGCFTDHGCCSGTCTHVWNYAQAMPHLFPQLERGLREMELERSMDERGHVNFRSALPDGPVPHDFHVAADGQLGGVLKLHRDWQISGDNAWLQHLYPLARRSLNYCISALDPDHRGVLLEPHHNTYDIEFWGAESMCSTIYIGALSAMAQMAVALGETEAAADYRQLARKGATHLDEHLFNGEYYHQEVQFKGLRDKSFLTAISDKTNQAKETQTQLELKRREGPSYQYGTGCLSDGVIGAWMAELYGVETPLTQRNVQATLRAIHRHNFRRDLSTHANLQRPGYALGDEAGLLLCSWPRGGKPTLPFVYSDEVWTGIEYQVASHLILNGQAEAGLEIVRAVRSRYTGRVRNPWNEYECGSYYARAMASYSVLLALSGFRYSAVIKTLWFAPQLPQRPFRAFFSAASAHGTVTLDRRSLTVTVLEGELDIRSVVLTVGGKTTTLDSAQVACPDKPARYIL